MATVLIVVVFMMASMTLNSLFATTVKTNDDGIRQELLFLQYQYGHGKLSLPHYTEFEGWDISVEQTNWEGKQQLLFMATNRSTGKELKLEGL